MAVRFGVIFIIDDDDKTKELLRSILERKKKCNFIGFVEIVIRPIESLFCWQNIFIVKRFVIAKISKTKTRTI